MSLAQGNNTPTRPRMEPGSPDPESDALNTRPVRPLRGKNLNKMSTVACRLKVCKCEAMNGFILDPHREKTCLGFPLDRCKTNALTAFVIAQIICTFAFAAKSRFSHNTAQRLKRRKSHVSAQIL